MIEEHNGGPPLRPAAYGKGLSMSSVNKVILVGNLGKDPEVRSTQDGAKIVTLTLATSEVWNDRASGERKERTEWHRVVIFNDRIGDVAERYLRKGRKVYIEGSLQTRKWTDQTGQDRYSTEVVIGRFRGELVLIDSARGGEGAAALAGTGGRDETRNVAPRPAAGATAGASWDAPDADMEDLVPF